MKPTSKNPATALRKDLLRNAEQFVTRQGLESQIYRSLGSPPTVLFKPHQDRGTPSHGNFHSESYRSILAEETWKERLGKTHSQKTRALRPEDRDGAKELDSCTSSDALLMNIFCHPSPTQQAALARLFKLTTLPTPDFGFKAKLRFTGGRAEPRSTEIDLKLPPEEGSRLVIAEAKLTEKGFTERPRDGVECYESFHRVFDAERLPQKRR